jgi:nitroimidazol reductase NimA-like FMN-containing flavoprotein (pyridoxamine 5'-phosphate oxidase superfamily)
MRRRDREIPDLFEIESILDNAMVCRIGLADDDHPYIVPVCFGYSDGIIYIHSYLSGKKIDMLKKNPRCCFEVDQFHGIIRDERPCAWGMRYQSVIGFGRAYFLSDSKEKKHGLNCIMRHYGCGMNEFPDDDIKNVSVIRIDIESMTGKKHG